MTYPHLPTIDYDLCTACGICVTACPTDALAMSDTGPFFSSPEDCSYCTDCESLCPSSAISCDFEITWGSESGEEISDDQIQVKGTHHE